MVHVVTLALEGGTLWPATLAQLVSPRIDWNTLSEKQGWQLQKNDIQGWS